MKKYIVENSAMFNSAFNNIKIDLKNLINKEMKNSIVRTLKSSQNNIKETIEPFVPMDTGALRQSFEAHIGLKDNNIALFVTYGKGLPDDRAWISHEDLYKKRSGRPTNWTTLGTQSKYLFIGGNIAASKVFQDIVENLRNELNRN